MKQTISGTYKPGSGDYDGMHSFESRKSDGFGGKMHTKVNESLKNFYTTNKLNPYISSMKITMDDSNFIVNWEVTIEESPDGKAYVGLTSRGGAGASAGSSGSINRAWNQIIRKKKDLPGEVSKKTITADIVDYNFKAKISGWGIRQIFVLYTNPDSYPDLPKSQNLQSGTVGVTITSTPSNLNNNSQLLLTSGVQTSTSNTSTPGVTSSVGSIDGTSVSSGGSFQFITLKNCFVSIPPRKNGSVPVILFYPKSEILETDEEIKNGYFSFSLENDKVTGLYPGIKLANRILEFNTSHYRLFGNIIDDELKSKNDSPVKEWFNRYVMVFVNQFDTDYNKVIEEFTEEIENRSLTKSSLNLVAYGESTHTSYPLIQSLVNKSSDIKSLVLMEPYPSQQLSEISSKIKSSGGYVYYTYNPNNFGINLSDTNTLLKSGLSYSGILITQDVSNINSFNYEYGSSYSLYLNGFTISTNWEKGRTILDYNYLNKITGTISGTTSTSGITYSFTHRGLKNESLPFTYTYLSNDLIKSGAYVYNVMETAESNRDLSGGTNSNWPSLKREPAPGQTSSGQTSSNLSDYTLRYLDQSTYTILQNIENIPQFTFEIFAYDIEKVIGKSANPSGPNDPPIPKIRGQFIFDVRKKGYLINEQLGEFKIIGKVEIDPFIKTQEDDLTGLAPEYMESEFMGEEESPENQPEVNVGYIEDEGSSQVNDTSTATLNNSTPGNNGPGVTLPKGKSAYSHNSTQGYNLVDSKWYGDLLTSALAHIDHPTFDIPGTESGALGCASWVSMVFYRAFGVHMKDGKPVKKIPKSIGDFGSEGTGALGGWFGLNPGMWERIPWKEGKPGDVINTERGSKAGHVGIVMDTINKDGSYNVASNSSAGFGNSGDPQGCGKLNYSIKKWQSVTNRNPNKTFCWRYKGPKLQPGQNA